MHISLAQFAFFFLSGISLVSAVLVISRRNPVHSVIWLIVTLFSVGGIFLTLRAEFLFAVQVILYVGGIMVLFLFVVMLVKLEATVKQATFSRQWPLGLFTVLILLAELIYGLFQQARRGFELAPSVQAPETIGNTQAIALSLYQNYMLPVEIASILLLVAMVGAVLMAKRKLE